MVRFCPFTYEFYCWRRKKSGRKVSFASAFDSAPINIISVIIMV